MQRKYFESTSKQEKLTEKSTQYKNIKVQRSTVDRLDGYVKR